MKTVEQMRASMDAMAAAAHRLTAATKDVTYYSNRVNSAVLILNAREMNNRGWPLRVALRTLLNTKERFTELHKDNS